MMLALAFALACGGGSKPPEAAAKETPPEVPSEPKVAACDGQNPGAWGSCEGQAVTSTGSRPQMEMQTPMVNGPDEHQTIVEIGGAQVIVLSKDAPTCTGAMAISGTVHKVALGGAPGTPESYEGWSLTGATITCQ